MIGYFELVVIIVSLGKCNIEYGVDLFIYKYFQLTAECDQQKYDTLPLEQLTVTRQNWWRYGSAYCCNIDLFILGCDSIIADNTINFSVHAFTYFIFFRIPSKPATTVVCRAWRLVNWAQLHKLYICVCWKDVILVNLTILYFLMKQNNIWSPLYITDLMQNRKAC